MLSERKGPSLPNLSAADAPWRPRRILLVTAGLLLACLGVLFWRVLFLGETFSGRDLAAYYHSAKSLIAPLARASQGIPVWNPFFSSGQPFAANPEHEFFYPLTALFFVLPFELAFRLQVIVPLLAACPSMYFLLRALRRSRAAACFGALAWTLGGYLLSTTNLLPSLFSISILPLSLGLLIRLLRQPSMLDGVALALCTGVQCLAGEPSTFVMLPPLCVAATLAVGRRRARGGIVAALLGLVLGVGLGAVTILPGLHHASKTERAAGLDAEAAGSWSMPPVRALELLAPYVLGDVVEGRPERFWGKSLYPVRESPFFFTLYPGLAVTLLAFAAWRHRPRALLPWIAVAAVGYLLALGEHFPLWQGLRLIPVLSGIRFPEKYVMVLILPLVVGAAQGCDQVVMGSERARRCLARVLLVLLIAAGLAGIGAALAGGPGQASLPRRLATGPLLHLATVSAGLLVLLWLCRSWRRTSRALAFAAFLAVDLVAAGHTTIHTKPVSALQSPPAFMLPLLRRGGDAPVFHAAEWHPTMGEAAGLAKPPQPAQWGVAMTLENDFDLTFLRWSNEGARAFWTAVRGMPSLASPLLERRGAGAIIQFRAGSEWREGGLVGPAGQGPVEVAFLPRHQDLVFAVSHVEIVRGSSGWLEAVSRLQASARDSACVDSESLPAFANPPSPANVTVRMRRPDAIAMEIDAKGPNASFVAFNQTWDEGWRLTVDRAPARLLRTEISLSGFVVPPGRHQVEIVYEDAWLDAGAVLSMMSGLACLGLVLARRLRRRGSP